MKSQKGRRGVALLIPLTAALVVGGWSTLPPAALGTHCTRTEGWLRLRVDLDGYEKPRPHRDRSPERLVCTESLYRLRSLSIYCTLG